jgi:hypothetical protein
MKRGANILIHMGASTFTADVRGADGNPVRFNLRQMDKQQEHRFRRELVKAFRKAGE